MTTPANKDISSWYTQGSSPLKDGSYPSSARPSGSSGTLKAFDVPVSSSAGRFSFFLDYSERATTGDHTFYVMRTHGSSGAVGVTWTASGDGSPTDTGTLAWADGENDIKSITVNVASKPSNGLHVIQVTLSSPTGGAALHNGTNTVAYGIINDSTVPSDSDAVFYDSAAGTGSGTAADPYGSIYTAITTLNSSGKRYLCGKGTTIPDGTFTDNINGGGTISCLPSPATRANEASRAFVMGWPGFTWTIDGTGSTSLGGFFGDAGQSYITYRDLDFTNINCTSTCNGFGVFYAYGGSSMINIEYCTADNINGATGFNNGAYMLWGVDGGKVWRSTSNNIQTNGDNTNTNTAGVYTYNGINLSVQRCEFSNSDSGIYHKRIDAATDVTTRMAFCHFNATGYGVHYGVSGSTGRGHNYGMAYCNLYEGNTSGGINHTLGGGTATSDATQAIWAFNNVFDSCGSGEIAAIHLESAFGTVLFNNIMYNCRKVWADYIDRSSIKTPDIEYANYNIESGTTLTSQRYEYRAVNYSTAAALNTAFGFAANDAETNPNFTDATNDDYTRTGGPTDGISSTETGIYLTGIEVIGA